jgi:hypothetical protein
MVRVDPHVGFAAGRASPADAGGVQLLHDVVELHVVDTETVVQHRKRAVVLVEVQRQAVADVHLRKGRNARLGPGHIQQCRKQLCRRFTIPCRNDQVIECYCHGNYSCHQSLELGI